jgi:colanic acid/amylovoran biosynthesis glycosyltransferase
LSSERTFVAYSDSHDLLPLVLTEDFDVLHRKRRVLNALTFALRHPFRFIRALSISVYGQPLDGLLVLVRSSAAAAELLHRHVDRIHSHFIRRACRHALLLSILTRIPYSFTTHAPQPVGGYFKPPRDLCLRARYASKIVTTTSYNRRYLERQARIPPEKIAVIPAAIDTSLFRPVEHGTRHNKIVLNVARLDSIKAQNMLVMACLHMRDLKVPFECKIIGDGPERASLLRQINDLGLDAQVRLLGAKTNREIVQHYQEASVFVMPSLFEGLGVAAMEAMACGVPVVATKVGGLPELVEDGRTGFLVEVGDHQELAGKIVLLLNDNQLRTKMGRRARRRATKHFDINRQVRRLTQALDLA